MNFASVKNATRPKGSRNKSHKAPRKTIAVRLTRAELARLLAVAPSPSKAIHTLINRLEPTEPGA